LTDTSLFIYVCVKHFGMANIKKVINTPGPVLMGRQ